jgi:hypothetical protein
MDTKKLRLFGPFSLALCIKRIFVKINIIVSLFTVFLALGSTSVFGKNKNELTPPPMAKEVKDSFEILRVWSDHNYSSQFIIDPKWEEPAVWGIALADIVKNIAVAHVEKHGGNVEEVQESISQVLLAELQNSTAPAQRVE